MATTESISSPPPATNRLVRWLWPKLFAGMAVAVLADVLFLDDGIQGLALALFLAALGLASVIVNRPSAPARRAIFAVGILLVGLAALVEEASILSVTLGVVGTVVFALAMREGRPIWLTGLVPRAIMVPVAAPILFARDLRRINMLAGDRWKGSSVSPAKVLGWVAPPVLVAVFAILLVDGNPILDLWVRELLALKMFDGGSLWRHPLLVLMVFVVIWPLMRMHRVRTTVHSGGRISKARARLDAVFGERPILSSLVMLNLLFALQTATDAVYLWGGAALPDGLTYADYAHRGAYPLILAALLAAGVVLVAMRQGGPAERSIWIRPLVLVWIGQNVSLVVSSILRLDLYVEVYSLTYWRFAAFIWMGLVAVGLGLIVAKIVLGRSNGWLLEMNTRTLGLVLAGLCFTNVPAIIADYNVGHMRSPLDWHRVWIDEAYLLSLGPQALPAIDTYARLVPERAGVAAGARFRFLETQGTGWRSWSFREWRLRRYLEAHPVPSPSPRGDAAVVQP